MMPIDYNLILNSCVQLLFPYYSICVLRIINDIIDIININVCVLPLLYKLRFVSFLINEMMMMMSAVYRRNTIGPRTDPCGTPYKTALLTV